MKLKIFLIVILCAVFLCSCNSSETIMNFNSEEYVELYDYTLLSVNYEYTQITYEDVERIIETEMSVNEAYIEVKDRTSPVFDDILLISINDDKEYYFIGSNVYSEEFDNMLLDMHIEESKTFTHEILGTLRVCLLGIYRTAKIDDSKFVLDYYNCASFVDLEKYIRTRAAEEIVFNYAYDMVCENSKLIGFPTEIQKQIENDIRDGKQEVLQQYVEFDDFLKDSGMTNEDFENNIASYYYEIILYKAILDKEKIELTNKEIEEYYAYNHTTNGYSKYDVFKDMAYNRIRDVLVKNTRILNKDGFE